MSKFIDSINAFTAENKSEIILGVSIVTGIAAGVLAWRNGHKAKLIVEEKKASAKEEHKEYTTLDSVKDTWKFWVPPVGLGIVAGVGAITSNRIKDGEKAALATAYGMATTAFTEYQKKVVETIGEKKEGQIRDSIAKDHVVQNPPVVTQIVGTGDWLCYDEVSHTYFRSNKQKIEDAINKLNHDMNFGNEPYKTENEYLSELGLPGKGPSSDKLGWTNQTLIEARRSYTSTDTGEPVMVITPSPMSDVLNRDLLYY